MIGFNFSSGLSCGGGGGSGCGWGRMAAALTSGVLIDSGISLAGSSSDISLTGTGSGFLTGSGTGGAG